MSRRIALAPHRWHVQETGKGPTVLLLPGSGSSVHTWRDLIPKLAETFHVVALDLPGQGFTTSPGGSRSGLAEMALDVAALVKSEGWDVSAIISHSAGSAIALAMVKHVKVGKIVGINPALDTFKGVAGWLFPLLARALAVNPLTASLFTFSATPKRSRGLIDGTGSRLDEAGYGFYARLMKDRAHVNGALNMMARWSLDPLLAEFPSIETPCLFITGDRDKAVPPDVANRAARALLAAKVVTMPGFGHLVHEETPDQVFDEIARFLAQ